MQPLHKLQSLLLKQDKEITSRNSQAVICSESAQRKSNSVVENRAVHLALQIEAGAVSLQSAGTLTL